MKINIFVGPDYTQKMILGIFFILIGLIGIGYYFGNKKSKKDYYDQKDYNNIFMNFHNATEYINHQYEEYVDICTSMGKTPMLLDQFKNEVKNNKDLQKELSKHGISLYSGK